MRKFALAAAISLLASSTVAHAQATWRGFYAGINAGYTWGNADTTSTPQIIPGGAVNQSFNNNITTLGTFDDGNSGFIGGLQLGYNWQVGNNFIVGLEADFQGSAAGHDHSGDRLVSNGTQTVTSSVTSELNYLGTLRGRLGYVVSPSLLVYGTGGLAYGAGSAKIQQALVPNSIDTPTWTSDGSSGVKIGWTAGAGVEWMMFSKVGLKGEYLYYDLGSYDAGVLETRVGGAAFTRHTVESELKGHIVRLGLNYHFD